MPTGIQRVPTRSLRGTIAAGETKDFDTLPLASFTATTYVIEVRKPDGTNSQAFNVFGAKITDDVSDQLQGVFRNGLNISLNLVKDGADVHVRITNNELFVCNVSLVKQST